MKMKYLLIFLAVFAFSTATSAQNPMVAAKKAEMAKLAKWAGQWKGSGWVQQGPQRETFTGSENVQMKLDGLALLVEGNFVNSEGKPAHQTLGVVSYNDKASAYDFATYLASGITGVQTLKIVGDHYEWGFDIPGGYGSTRFNIKVDDTTWFETGEFSRDGGKTWFKNFEMTLTRLK
jgi:hypothetical protein